MQVQSKGLLGNVDIKYPETTGLSPSAAESIDVDQIKKLSEEFESIFLDMMLKSMRKAVQESDLVKKSNGEDIFRSMLDSEYSKEMAIQRISGISDAIESHMLKAMEMSRQSLNEIKGFAVYQGLDCIPFENKGE